MLLEFDSSMETLVIVVELYRNEFFTRVEIVESGRFGNLMMDKRKRKNKNRLSLGSGTGSRPTPLEISSSIPVPRFSNPKSPVPLADCSNSRVNSEICIDFDEQDCPERWAGPTYMNSPSASSLPMPTFPIRRNRTESELLTNSVAESVEKDHPIVKSAPPSPTRCHNHPSSREPFHGADSATKTLKRILNLDDDSE